MVSLAKQRAVVNRLAPADTIPVLIRHGDSWQRIDHDLSGFPYRVGIAHAGMYTCEIWAADPFHGNEFFYRVQVDLGLIGAEFVLLRGLAELLDFVRELRGLTK